MSGTLAKDNATKIDHTPSTSSCNIAAATTYVQPAIFIHFLAKPALLCVDAASHTTVDEIRNVRRTSVRHVAHSNAKHLGLRTPIAPYALHPSDCQLAHVYHIRFHPLILTAKCVHVCVCTRSLHRNCNFFIYFALLLPTSRRPSSPFHVCRGNRLGQYSIIRKRA